MDDAGLLHPVLLPVIAVARGREQNRRRNHEKSGDEAEGDDFSGPVSHLFRV